MQAYQPHHWCRAAYSCSTGVAFWTSWLGTRNLTSSDELHFRPAAMLMPVEEVSRALMTNPDGIYSYLAFYNKFLAPALDSGDADLTWALKGSCSLCKSSQARKVGSYFGAINVRKDFGATVLGKVFGGNA